MHPELLLLLQPGTQILHASRLHTPHTGAHTLVLTHIHIHITSTPLPSYLQRLQSPTHSNHNLDPSSAPA